MYKGGWFCVCIKVGGAVVVLRWMVLCLYKGGRLCVCIKVDGSVFVSK